MARPPLAIHDELGATARPRLAAYRDHLALCTGAAVKLYAADAPVADLRFDAPIVAVARSRTHAAALDATGVLHVVDGHGKSVGARPVGDRPRALYALPDEGFVALVEAGLVMCDARSAITRRVEIARPLAGAFTADRRMVVIAEEHRLAEWTGSELVDIPPSAEQLVAIATLGDARFACVGQKHWFLLDLAERELESIAQPSGSPHVATTANGARIAWMTGRTVHVGRLQKSKLVTEQRITYSATYGTVRELLGMFTTVDPNDEPLAVSGLAFLDDDHLAIALDAGRGNIIDLRAEPAKAARKLDEYPGEPHASWQFEYQGQTLITP